MTIPMIASDEIQEEESPMNDKAIADEFQAHQEALPRGQTGVERPISIEQRPETCKQDWSKSYAKGYSESAKVESRVDLDMNQDKDGVPAKPAERQGADSEED